MPAVFVDRTTWRTKGMIVTFGSDPYVIVIEIGMIAFCEDRDSLKFARDTLLHELVHYHLFVNNMPHNHGKHFTRLCNRIGNRIGLPAVSSRGYKNRPQSFDWPACTRGERYHDELENIYCRIRLERAKESVQKLGKFTEAEAIDFIQILSELERVLSKGEYGALLLMDQLCSKIAGQTGLIYRTEIAFLKELQEKYARIKTQLEEART